jgi:acyl-CoA thioesterase-2
MQNDSTISSVDPGPAPLEQLVSLEALGPSRFASRAHQTNRNGVLYGGQLIAQALAAAIAVTPERQPHALQLAFQSPGTAQSRVMYDVELTSDGGSLSTRRVVAMQGASVAAFATVSFKHPRNGYEHQDAWRDAPPPPESLCTLAELEARYADKVSAHGRGRLRCYPQVDVRPVDAERHLLLAPGEPRCQFWIRAKLLPASDAATRCAALAYLSDYLLVNAALVPHAGELPPHRLFVASLNHAMWFHADTDPGEWLFYDTHSPFAGGGHVLCQGRFYTRDGRLVASTAQEAMVRPLAVSS